MFEVLVWFLIAEWVGGFVAAAAIAALILSARFALRLRPAVRNHG